MECSAANGWLPSMPPPAALRLRNCRTWGAAAAWKSCSQGGRGGGGEWLVAGGGEHEPREEPADELRSPSRWLLLRRCASLSDDDMFSTISSPVSGVERDGGSWHGSPLSAQALPLVREHTISHHA